MSTPEFYLQRVLDEYTRFRTVIDASPADQLDYRPDPTARSARELIGHLIGHTHDLIELIDDKIIHHRNVVQFDALPDALELFDQSYKEFEGKLASLDESGWEQSGDFYAGEHLVMSAPTHVLLWEFFLDSIHHRGQLSTYLRPMGGKVPAIYAPSADDPGDH